MTEPKCTKGPWEAQTTRVYGGNKLLFKQEWWDSPEEFLEAQDNAVVAALSPRMYDLIVVLVKSAYAIRRKNDVFVWVVEEKLIEEAMNILKEARKVHDV